MNTNVRCSTAVDHGKGVGVGGNGVLVGGTGVGVGGSGVFVGGTGVAVGGSGVFVGGNGVGVGGVAGGRGPIHQKKCVSLGTLTTLLASPALRTTITFQKYFPVRPNGTPNLNSIQGVCIVPRAGDSEPSLHIRISKSSFAPNCRYHCHTNTLFSPS